MTRMPENARPWQEALERAHAAATEFAATSASQRATYLEAMAAAIRSEIDSLVTIAEEETHISDARLRGEVERTCGQLELFASILRDGDYVGAIIDSAAPDATPPRPEVRRMLHPLGPVAVFAASNFPFAFSVAGGDTASALAAGCPVVVKAHSGHPRLSVATAVVVERALQAAGAPDGVFSLVSGREAGTSIVIDPRISAAGFTGSLQGGRALFDLAVSRPDPIPFFGELGSVNPVVISAHASKTRSNAIAAGLVASFTLGVGQLCTKPGVIFVPTDSDIPALAAELTATTPGGRMLTDRIGDEFRRSTAGLASGGVAVLRAPVDSDSVTPVIAETRVEQLLVDSRDLLEERFGPFCLFVRYNPGELEAGLALVPGSLTATIHADDDELESARALLPLLRAKAGRIVWNGWPTGVAVTRSMVHGGPWPATTASQTTSVGGTAIERFLRPVAYQGLPDLLVPEALKASNPLSITRRIDGVLTRDPLPPARA